MYGVEATMAIAAGVGILQNKSPNRWRWSILFTQPG